MVTYNARLLHYVFQKQILGFIIISLRKCRQNLKIPQNFKNVRKDHFYHLARQNPKNVLTVHQ